MKPSFRATGPEDFSRLREFLTRTLLNEPGAPFFKPGQFQWKYWDHRADWDGPRSFVVERGGELAAHGAAWPVDLVTGQGAIRGFHLVDWAADPGSPGIGVALMRKMSAMADLIWVLGGSDAARRMREAMGFRVLHPVSVLALPLRPAWMEWSREAKSWKTPGRWLRNTGWAWARRPAGKPWRAVAAGDPRSLRERWGEIAGPGLFRSSVAIGDYLARCPVAQFKWWEVWRGEQPAGYFCLALTPGRARLADAWIAPDSVEDWRAVARLAAAAAHGLGMGEIAAWAARPPVRDGFREAGFQVRVVEELMVYDPKQRLEPGQFHFQMAQGDQVFLHSGRPAFLC